MAGAHLVDDPAGLVLHIPGLGHIALQQFPAHSQVQLRHGAVGAADAADGAHGQAADELLIGTVEHDGALVPPHLDVLGGHGGVLHADAAGVLQHFLQQGHAEGDTRQLGNVIDDEVGVGRGGGHVIPVFGNGVGGQLKVDGGNGGNGIHAQAFGVGGQLLGIPGVVAGHVGDDGELAPGLGHDVFQHQLPLGHALIDALAGGAADVQALDALFHIIPGQLPDSLGVNLPLGIIAGIERGNDALILLKISHK